MPKIDKEGALLSGAPDRRRRGAYPSRRLPNPQHNCLATRGAAAQGNWSILIAVSLARRGKRDWRSVTDFVDHEIDASEVTPQAGSGFVLSVCRRLVNATWYDMRVALWHLLLNSIAGSVWTPRVARFVLYRALGVDVRTIYVSDGVRFTSRDITIHRGTFVNRGVMFEPGPIEIGSGCQIGFDVKFITSTHSYRPDGTVRGLSHQLPVKVGNRCWIGAGAIILPNVTICDDVTVGAGAVVTRDLDRPGLYAGVPAIFKRDLIVANGQKPCTNSMGDDGPVRSKYEANGVQPAARNLEPGLSGELGEVVLPGP